jgi:hypothetical protein
MKEKKERKKCWRKNALKMNKRITRGKKDKSERIKVLQSLYRSGQRLRFPGG